jgi:tyrosyl-tRNA synthetase
VLQAFDFLELYRTRGCVLQIGGSDQWGNITAGCELVRKSANTTVHGLTLPLIVTADGVKFGKSAGNAVWLDADMTSPYHLYQFLVNTADADIEKLLLHLTLLSPAKVADVMVEHSAAPHTRSGQHTLAREIVRLVHGQAHLERAEATSAALFRGDPLNVFDAVELQDLFANAPAVTWPLPGTEAKDEWPTLVDLAVHAGLSGSKKQARRSIAAGGLYVNNVKVETERLLSPTDILHNTVTVLRAGKKNYVVVKWL